MHLLQNNWRMSWLAALAIILCLLDCKTNSPSTPHETASQNRETYDLTSVAFSPDGKMIATGGRYPMATLGMDRGFTILWDVQTGEKKQTLKASKLDVFSVAFSPDSNVLAVGYTLGIGILTLWDVQTGESLRDLKRPDPNLWVISSIAFSPDGKMLASGGGDGMLIMWDVQTGEIKRGIVIRDVKGHVEKIAFSPNSKMVAFSIMVEPGMIAKVGNVVLWDVQGDKMKFALPVGRQREVISIAFSPDGKTLACGGGEGVVLLDVQKGEMKRTQEMRGSVNSVAFSPDGKTLVSGQCSRVILWDTQTGDVKRELTWHEDQVVKDTCVNYWATFSPDRKTVASWSRKVVRLWDAQTGEVKRALMINDSHVRDAKEDRADEVANLFVRVYEIHEAIIAETGGLPGLREALFPNWIITSRLD